VVISDEDGGESRDREQETACLRGFRCITYCIVPPLCFRGSVGARGYGMGPF
jgi:hypothetical protein